MIGAERIREALSYDPQTGIMTWRISLGHGICGRPAGYVDSRGYLRIGFDHGEYGLHRLAFAHHHGRWPSKNIDHIDGNRLNNAISNLREADLYQNAANRPKQKNSSSGLKGVTWHAQAKKWQASIGVRGRTVYLGLFVQKEEAGEAYRRAAIQYFGEFAWRQT